MKATRCEHGLSGDLRPDGTPRCQVCRVLLGDLAPTTMAAAADDRCGKTGHELHPRQNCPGCASERAEAYGSLETRVNRAKLRQTIRRPTERSVPEPGELTHAAVVNGLDRESVMARPLHRPVKGGFRVVDGGAS